MSTQYNLPEPLYHVKTDFFLKKKIGNKTESWHDKDFSSFPVLSDPAYHSWFYSPHSVGRRL